MQSTPQSLQRVDSRSSGHARTSLRRMISHETGTGVERAEDGRSGGLGTHDEHEHEHEHDTGSGSTVSEDSSTAGPSTTSHGDVSGRRGEEEKSIGISGTPPNLDPSGTGGIHPTEGMSKKKRKVVELEDQTNLLPVKQVITVFAGLSMALFCSLLDQTIVTTALPTLGQVFGRADIVSWVGTAYLLTSTAMQPIYGRLSDIFGRKPVLLASCVIFLLGSIGCSVSASMIELICFRAIQGVGGGGILTLSMVIVSDIVTLKERGKYQGIQGCVVALANSLGPIIGGLLTEKATWRWCFWLSIPLTSIGIIVIIFVLPIKPVSGSPWVKLRRVDWIGSFLTLAWAVLVLIALSWAGTTYAWSSAGVLAPLLVGLALLGVFIYVELHPRLTPLPLIPFSIFKNVTVWAAMLATFFSGVAFYCLLYYLPTYFQTVKGATAIQSGVLILPLVIVQTSTVFISGYIVSKTGDYWWNLVLGFGIWTIGLGCLTTIGIDTPDAHLYGFQVLVGIGAGQTFQTSLIAIQAAVERKEMATATGTRQFLRMLGGTIGLAACGSLVNNVVRTRLSGIGIESSTIDKILKDPSGRISGHQGVDEILIREAYARGISSIFYLMFPLTAIACLLSIFFIRKIPLKRADDAQKKEEAKQWVESKRHGARTPHRDGESGNNTPVESPSIGHAKKALRRGGDDDRGAKSDTTADSHPHLRREIDAMGEAGRGMEEAAGALPTDKEGVEQGPVGSNMGEGRRS